MQAYTIYSNTVLTTFDNKKMPDWDDLEEKQKNGWRKVQSFIQIPDVSFENDEILPMDEDGFVFFIRKKDSAIVKCFSLPQPLNSTNDDKILIKKCKLL